MQKQAIDFLLAACHPMADFVQRFTSGAVVGRNVISSPVLWMVRVGSMAPGRSSPKGPACMI
jgi:hypothetical protein